MSPQPVVHVRRNVWTLPEDDLTLAHYAAAVTEMKRRDADDPTSWAYQAAIHGTSETPPKPLWNSCKHGSWFFLSWHRMYLWYFERIVRATVVDLGGPADWALPFWDYDADPSQARIPPAFRDAEGGANSLFAERAHRLNLGDPLPFEITSPAYAMGRTQFVGEAEFGGGITPDGDAFWNRDGAVESTPHNAVHSHIGRWMGRTDTAALDPIFWLHHANIDRLWFEWASRPGHGNPTDPRWITQEYRFFDADGSERRLAASAVVDIAGQLRYTYESPVPVPPPPPVPPLSPSPPLPRARGADEWSERVRADTAQAARDGRRVTADRAARRSRGERHRTDRPADDAVTRHGAGCPRPRGRPACVPQRRGHRGRAEPRHGLRHLRQPARRSPRELAESHRVGNLSFFGIERAQDPRGDEHPHGLRVTVEITPLVRRLVAEDAWDDRALRVTFLPLGPRGPADAETEDPPVEIGRVSLGYT